MPYPLPDDVSGVVGLRYYLVAIPDDPTYSKAALGAYTDLGKYWKWGLEGPVPGDSDLAALQWQDAIAETIRLIQMGFPDDLIAAIDEIEAKLDELIEKDECCDDNVLYDVVTDVDGVVQGEEDQTGADVVVGEGDPPGGAEDWDAYAARLCDGATKFAQFLVRWFVVLQTVSTLTTIGLGAGLAYLVGGLAAIGITGAAIAGAFGVLTVLDLIDNFKSLLDTNEPFTTEKAEVEDSETIQAVICAIVQAATPADAAVAVIAALDTYAPNASPYVQWLPLDWLMRRYMSLESDASAGFGGGCSGCPEPEISTITWTWDTDLEGWTVTNPTNAYWYDAAGNPDAGSLFMGATGIARSPVFNMAAGTQIQLDAYVHRNGGPGAQVCVSVALVDETDTLVESFGSILCTTGVWQLDTNTINGTFAAGLRKLQFTHNSAGLFVDTLVFTISTP